MITFVFLILGGASVAFKFESVDKSSPSYVPAPGECGVGVGSPAFIICKDDCDTKLGEYPWMVLLGRELEVRGQREKDFFCGGSLLNNWYVLSAAHCHQPGTINQVDFVRVGEWKVVDTDNFDRRSCKYYNEKTKTQCRNDRSCGRFCTRENGELDCQTVGGQTRCAEQHQDVNVAKIIRHPRGRKGRTGVYLNDIMLLKLEKPVTYNKFVSPICLPDPSLARDFGEPGRTSLSFGKPIVAGWGVTQNRSIDHQITPMVASTELRSVQVPVVSINQCNKDFNNQIQDELHVDIHLCAGGEKDEDSCKGDSGGPLIARESDISPYMVVGIVSGGTTKCGIGAPGIYTRVTTYLRWIRRNMV